MLSQLQLKPAWRDRLAILGGVAACAIAAKAARVLWLRATLRLGPVRVKKGEWALVTGGSEGLGKGIAASLARHGLNIVLVSRSKDKLEAAQQEIQAKHQGVQVRIMPCDLTKPDDCRKLLQKLSATPIACLVANAGGGVKGFCHYWNYTDAEDAAVQSLNGTACYTLVRGLLPGMLERGSGAVVAISSIMHKHGAMAAPYGAEKAKINALMEALDIELKLAGVKGVTCQSMVIGGVLTPATLKMIKPELSSASPAEMNTALEAEARRKGNSMFRAQADSVGEAVVRAIGRGGPVVTPHWKHWVVESLFLDPWWPPSLGQTVKASITRSMLRQINTVKQQLAAQPAARPDSRSSNK